MSAAPGIAAISLFYAPNRLGFVAGLACLLVMVLVTLIDPAIDQSIAWRAIFSFMLVLAGFVLIALHQSRIDEQNTQLLALNHRLRDLLKASEKDQSQLRAINELVGVGDFELSFETGKVTLGEGLRKFFNLSEESGADLTIDQFLARMSDSQRASLSQRVDRIKALPESFITLDCVEVDGQRRWWKRKVSPVFNDQEQLVGMRSASVNVTDLVEAEATNRVVSAKFERLLEASNANWYRVDFVTGECQVNTAWRTFYGLSEDDFPVINWAVMAAHLPPETLPVFDQMVDQLRAEQTDFISYGTLQNAAGERCTLKNFTSPIFNEAGELIGAEGFAFDITSEIRAKEKLELALSASGTGLFEHDFTTNRFDLSGAARELFDLPESEFPGLVPLQVLLDRVEPGFLAQVKASIQQAVRSGELVHVVWPIVPRDGRRRLIAFSAKVFFQEGQPVLGRGAVADVTELEETRQKLADSLATLKDLQAKRNILFGMVAHELRTPVSTISMLADEQDDSAWIANRSNVKRSSEDMLHTIDDMRMLINPDLVRPVRQQPFLIDELNASISSSVATIVTSSGFQLRQSNEIPAELRNERFESDIYRIRVAVTNLIKNACLHSRGSWVSMSSRVVEEQQNSYLEWVVRDDGVGIADHRVAALFTPGVRGDSPAEGSGLGLYITRSWIAEIGGQVSYHRTDQGGSEFSVRVPLVVSSTEVVGEGAGAEKTLRAAEKRLASLRVLLVEDEAMLRMLGAKLLTNLGCSVDVAANGHEGLALADQGYDLILTDYFMPELSGVEMTQQLRDRGCTVPIVGITAATIGEQRSDLLQAGADAVLPKPLTAQAFRGVIQELLESGRLQG